jgi:hypothetical protein
MVSGIAARLSCQIMPSYRPPLFHNSGLTRSGSRSEAGLLQPIPDGSNTTDRFSQPAVQGLSGLPAQLVVDLGDIHGIPAIMSRSIDHKLDQRSVRDEV